METLSLKGTIIEILPKKTGVSKNSGKEWAAQEYVLETHDAYPKKLVFQVFGEEKIADFNIKMNQNLEVFFNIDANKWKDKWVS